MFQLNQVVFGNTLVVWSATVLTAVALGGGLGLLRRILLQRVGRSASFQDSRSGQFLHQLIAHTHPLFMTALALALALQIPHLPPRTVGLLQLLGPLALLLQAAAWGNLAVTFWVAAPLREGQSPDRASGTRGSVVTFILRLALGSLLLLTALSLLGFNITTLLASLGIGGIAVALALQNILGDLFGSLSIALDQPFVVGDFIVVDEFLVTVEYVGLKTTRVRSLSGEQIIFSNTDLLKSRIRNFKRMLDRRVLFSFSLAYETTPEQLERLPQSLRRMIEGQAGTRFDRAHFKGFERSGLVFEVVYIVLDPDMNRYMNIQESINLELCRLLRAEGISFAAPRRLICSMQTEP